MKNLKIQFVLFIAVTACLAGCSEEFLQEEPRDTLFAETLFENKDGFRQALNAVYSLAREERIERGSASHEVSCMWKTGTDTAWGNYTYQTLRAVDIYGTNLTPADNTLSSVFNWLYDVVNASNTIITRSELPGVDWQGGSEAEDLKNKNIVVAQARFFRAWAYRHLVNSWGDVPLSTEEINGSNFKTYFELVPAATIRAVMEEDLLFAEANLPNNYNDPIVLSSAIAQHYLAELYLTLGGQENYIKAEQKAELAIANPNFQLITQRFGPDANQPGVPFMDQFGERNALASQGNTETLWSFLNAVDLPGSEDVAMRRTWVNRYFNLTTDDFWAFAEYGGRGLGRAMYTPYVEDLYEDQDDRYSKFAISKSYLKTQGGDEVFTRVPSFAAWKVNDASWPATKKWDSYPDLERVDNSGQYNNMPYVRLAETYLLAAEAEVRLGKNGEAKGHIDALRLRSNATQIALSDVGLTAILDERARELITEEHRRYVLNRFGLLVSRTLQFNKFSKIEDKNVLYPLPQDFIDSNAGPTPQNAGY